MNKGQIKFSLANPTTAEGQNYKEYIDMKAKELFKFQTSIIETYLSEYCEVNGITEAELGDLFILKSNPLNLEVSVVDVKDTDKVVFGVRVCIETSFENNTAENKYSVRVPLEVMGFYDKEKFPKTVSMLLEYDNRGRDIDTVKGE